MKKSTRPHALRALRLKNLDRGLATWACSILNTTPRHQVSSIFIRCLGEYDIDRVYLVTLVRLLTVSKSTLRLAHRTQSPRHIGVSQISMLNHSPLYERLPASPEQDPEKPIPPKTSPQDRRLAWVSLALVISFGLNILALTALLSSRAQKNSLIPWRGEKAVYSEWLSQGPSK